VIDFLPVGDGEPEAEEVAVAAGQRLIQQKAERAATVATYRRAASRMSQRALGWPQRDVYAMSV